MGDDRVRIVDRFGAQVAELTVLADDGREDPSALHVDHDGPATVIRRLAASGHSGFVAELPRPWAPARRRHATARMFGPDSPRAPR